MPSHLSLDDSLSAFLAAAKSRTLSLCRYDNPETRDDEGWRLLQPIRIVQARSNLLGHFWQYAPSADYRTFRFHFFTHILPTPYPALFDSAATFDLDRTLTWGQLRALPRGQRPFDRRSRKRADAEIFYLDAVRTLKASGDTPNPKIEHPPEWLATYGL